MHHLAEITIAIFYILFAIQLFSQAKAGAVRDRRNRAFFCLIAVFVLCSFAGYLGPALNLPMAFDLALHTALAIAAGVLVVTNQAKTIAAMLASV